MNWQPVFVWTIGDILGVAFGLLAFGSFVGVTALEWAKQWHCKHDGEVNETSACDAVCRKCGKNLGFIGTWREKNKVPSRNLRSG